MKNIAIQTLPVLSLYSLHPKLLTKWLGHFCNLPNLKIYCSKFWPFSERNYKIAHIHTIISIRMVHELTCNISKKFLQDITYSLYKFFCTIWIVSAIHLKKLSSLRHISPLYLFGLAERRKSHGK